MTVSDLLVHVYIYVVCPLTFFFVYDALERYTGDM